MTTPATQLRQVNLQADTLGEFSASFEVLSPEGVAIDCTTGFTIKAPHFPMSNPNYRRVSAYNTIAPPDLVADTGASVTWGIGFVNVTFPYTTMNWTCSTLQEAFSILISNDSGTTWSCVANGTLILAQVLGNNQGI